MRHKWLTLNHGMVYCKCNCNHIDILGDISPYQFTRGREGVTGSGNTWGTLIRSKRTGSGGKQTGDHECIEMLGRVAEVTALRLTLTLSSFDFCLR